ncbi:hypothetical protein DDR33_05520 [Pararcticibacter amylolyticus]|uniref:Uncharacterized protein n=1 Tax=Pararcticibacter amylolyticus TaxID=2173175 RepID=A0A2U2PKX4_9SPHI|nr:hypothetical protein DDR33_05520 [Pararcticibacter amylolyticus]
MFNVVLNLFQTGWHARGHRFDSDILHLKIRHLQIKVSAFFFGNLPVTSKSNTKGSVNQVWK